MQAPASRRRLFVCFGTAALFVFGLDQLTKWLATTTLLLGKPVPFLGEVVRFSLTHNTGAAFGLLPVHWVLVCIGLLFCIGLPLLLWQRTDITASQGLLLALIWGGSAGNLLDRLRTGAVIDFIDVRIWPVFNIADIAITVGFALLALQLLLRRP